MRDRLLVLLFLAVIGLPGAMHAWRAAAGDHTLVLTGENRRAAAFPALRGGADAEAFVPGVEAWMGDRFGLRGPLTRLYATIRREFGLSARDDMVVEGADGWLFLAQGGRMQDDVEGAARLRPAQAAAWTERIRTVETYAEDQGAVFAFMLAPDKHTVYPDRLPAGLQPAPLRTRRALLLPQLAAAGVRVVDPAPDLLGARGEAALYHRTDTHWNDEGAYRGYRALTGALAAAGVPVTPLPSDALTREMETLDGDLPPMMGRAAEAETVLRRRVPPSLADRIERRALDDHENRDLRTLVLTGGPPDAPTLTIYGDSFAPAMLPYLAQSFSRVTLLRRQEELADLERLARHPADVIVLELVERNLREPMDVVGADGAV